MKKSAVAVLLAAVMLLSIIPLFKSSEAIEPSQSVGYNLSEFSTTDTYDNPVDGSVFSEYKLTLLNLWATWCTPCKAEMPHLQKLYVEYQDKGLNVMGLLQEDSMSTVSGANALFTQYGYTYTNLRLDRVLRTFVDGTDAIPDSYLVDRTGRVVAVKEGSFSTYGDLENWVTEVLNRPEPDSVSLPEELSMFENRMTTLNAVIEPANSLYDAVVWSSSDESIATVDQTGVVKSITPGTTDITVTVKSETKEVSAVCALTVLATPEFNEGDVYYRPVKAPIEGKDYLLIAENNGSYYMVANEIPMGNLYSVAARKVDYDDLQLMPDDRMLVLSADKSVIWNFEAESDGFTAYNNAGDKYLTAQRNNGIYKLTLKSSGGICWVSDNGMLAAAEGSYSGDAKYVSYDPTNGSFELMSMNDENFRGVMFYEKTVAGVDDTEEPTTPPATDIPETDDPTTEPPETDDPTTEPPETDDLTTESPAPTEPPMPGDLNNSGNLDAGDATMILRAIVGSGEPLTEQQQKLADMNDNGIVDTGDATMVLRKVVGAE